MDDFETDLQKSMKISSAIDDLFKDEENIVVVTVLAFKVFDLCANLYAHDLPEKLHKDVAMASQLMGKFMANMYMVKHGRESVRGALDKIIEREGIDIESEEFQSFDSLMKAMAKDLRPQVFANKVDSMTAEDFSNLLDKLFS
jgi:hypothetical protein